MSIVYMCRHCGHKIGELDLQVVDYSMLGIDQLTSDERRRMVHYEEDGNIRIDAICDDCQSALKEHPRYHELDFFIQ